MDKILLFLPCYNCETQIPRVLAQLDEEVMGFVSEVLVINNRSTDGTERVVLDFVKSHPNFPLRLLRNDQNYNLGGSHKVAFAYAIEQGFDYVIVLHSDDQGDIHDMLPVLRDGTYQKHDCCLGARFTKDQRLQGYSGFRIFGNKVYNMIFSIAIGKKVTDLGSGLNLYKVSVLKQNFYQRFPDRLTFPVYMLVAYAHYKFDIYFTPISWRETDQVSNVKMASQARQTLSIALCYMFCNHDKYFGKEFREQPIAAYTAQQITEEGKDKA